MVDRDATPLEVAAVMARMHSPLVAVVDGDGHGEVIGAITVSRLLDHLLPRGRRTRDHRARRRGVRRGLRPHRHRADPPGRRGAVRGRGDGASSGSSTPRWPSSASETGVDWNVIFLLLGMMVIVSVLKQTGVFEYLAIWAAKRARGRPFATDGAAGADHRRRLGAAGQRHHGAADRAGDAAGVRPAGSAAGAVPDRRGVGLQHRRHRDPGRRPAEHHHRQPGRAVLQRLPGQPRARHRARAGRLPRPVPGPVPVRVPLRRRPRRGADGAGRA